MNTGQSDAAPSLLSRVEQLIKLAASLAAVAAATGLPAVYIQYSNLGIPNSFITSEQILRAGIAPGSLFLFVGAYVLLLIQEYENGRAGLGAFMGPGIMFVPVPVFAIIVLYVGLFALGVWVWWVVLYPLFWLIGTERVRQVHFWVANGAAFLNLVPPLAGAYIWPFVAPYVLQFVAFLVILQRTPRWVVPILSAVARIANETTLDQKETKPANKSESEGPPVVPSPMEEQERKEVSKFRIFAWITAGFAVFLPAGLFAIRWYLQQLEMSPGPLAETSQVLLFSGVGTLGLAAFFLFVGSVEYMSHANAGTQLLVTSLNISIVTALFASAVWWYSTTLYPRMPAALGGGKPETVAVWLDAKALPLEVRTLGGADCTAEAPIVRCRLQLIYRNDKDVILAAPGDGRRAAVLVPRDTIKAVSW